MFSRGKQVETTPGITLNQSRLILVTCEEVDLGKNQRPDNVEEK